MSVLGPQFDGGIADVDMPYELRSICAVYNVRQSRLNIFLKGNQIEPILRRTGQILCYAAKGQIREIIADKLPLLMVFSRKDRASD